MMLLREPRYLIEHACILLDICQGSLEEARQLCYLNIRLGEFENVPYWMHVAQMLEQTGQA